MRITSDHTERLNLARVQRLRSFCARYNGKLIPILRSFVENAQTPGLDRALPLSNANERYHTAWLASQLIKNIGVNEGVRTTLESLGETLTRSSQTPPNAKNLKPALLAAIKSHANPDWSPELEEDWNEAIDAWLSTSLGVQAKTDRSRAQPPLRKAA